MKAGLPPEEPCQYDHNVLRRTWPDTSRGKGWGQGTIGDSIGRLPIIIVRIPNHKFVLIEFHQSVHRKRGNRSIAILTDQVSVPKEMSGNRIMIALQDLVIVVGLRVRGRVRVIYQVKII